MTSGRRPPSVQRSMAAAVVATMCACPSLYPLELQGVPQQ